jgi:DNA-binding IclR family transcriptional regulator
MANDENRENQYVVQSVDTALKVLDCFLNLQEHELGVTDLSERLEISKSQTFRMLTTLERRGYIQKTNDRRYRLGLRLFELGEFVRSKLELTQVAKTYMAELATKSGDTTHLIIRDHLDAICIDKHQGDNPIQVVDQIWRRSPLYACSAPKILLAYEPEEERERILDQLSLAPFTDTTITDKLKLRDVLEDIRERGYCICNEELDEGVVAVGAPVFSHSGKVVAATSITAPRSRMPRSRMPQLIEWVSSTTREISAGLGYSEQ